MDAPPPPRPHHSVTLGVIGLTFGILATAGALWAVSTAVRRWIAPHGVEWGSLSYVLFALGVTFLLVGLFLAWKGIEEIVRATEQTQKAGETRTPLTPYRAKDHCPECGRWDGKATPGCNGCQELLRSS